MRDKYFQAMFRRMFVYNILFEDAEVDGQWLGIDEDSRVLGISAAGCGLASMVRFQPRHIDAVDINRHHLALAGLKMAAARDEASYGQFYDLFGRGWLPRPEPTVRKLAQGLPPWMQRYWKLHHRRFNRSLYQQGLTARMLTTLRKMAGVDTEWMRWASQLPLEERQRVITELFEPLLRQPAVSKLMDSPVQLLALGVNYEQKERMLKEEGGDMADFFINHMRKVASTDMATNWFAWYAIAGHYNHDRNDAVPPYLRQEAHETSSGSPTNFRFHHDGIFEVMARAGTKTWTHYTLCDAVDWMPRPVQTKLLSEIHRTARPGAVVLMRSVDVDDIVEANGFSDRFKHMGEASSAATRDDRSKQYKRVDFYQVQA